MSKGTVYTQQLKLRQQVAPRSRIANQTQAKFDRALPRKQEVQSRKLATAQKNLAIKSRAMPTYYDEKNFFTASGKAVPRMTAGASDQYGGVGGYAKAMSKLYGEDITEDMVRGQTSYKPSGEQMQNAPRDSANNAAQIARLNEEMAKLQKTPEQLMQGMQSSVFTSPNSKGFLPSTKDLWAQMPAGSLPQDKVIEDLINKGWYGEAVKVRQGELGMDDPSVQGRRGISQRDQLRPAPRNPFAAPNTSPATGSTIAGATAQFSDPQTSQYRNMATAGKSVQTATDFVRGQTRSQGIDTVKKELEGIGAIPAGTGTTPYKDYLAGRTGAESYNPRGEAWTQYESPTIQTSKGGSYGGYEWGSDAVPQPAQQMYGQDYGLLQAMRGQYDTAREADQARREAERANVESEAQSQMASLEKGYTEKIAQLRQSWAKRGIMDSSTAIEGEKEALLESQNAQERLKISLAEQLTKLAGEGKVSEADAELAFQKMQYEMMQDGQETSMKMAQFQQGAMEAQRKGDLDLMKYYQSERQNLIENEYKKAMMYQIQANLSGTNPYTGQQTKESSRAGAERNISYAEYMGYQYNPHTGEIVRDARGNPVMNSLKQKSSGGGGGSGGGTSVMSEVDRILASVGGDKQAAANMIASRFSSGRDQDAAIQYLNKARSGVPTQWPGAEVFSRQQLPGYYVPQSASETNPFGF